jgi:O-antigen ligase
LEKLWKVYWWRPNESHNGYLEVYLNLGWVGVSLLAVLLVTGYRNILRIFNWRQDAGPLRLALFVVAIAYNLTEAAMRTLNPVWIFFMLSIIALPEPEVAESETAQPEMSEVEEAA